MTSDQVKDDEKGRACSMIGKEYEYIYIGGKT
jgi:hypothetical protein